MSDEVRSPGIRPGVAKKEAPNTMISIASKGGGLGMLFVVTFSTLACGGRIIDDGSAPGNGTTPPTDTPVPTCSQICRRAVDVCFPGASIDQCARDCETARTEFKGCEALLDAFLRCRGTAVVTCTEKVIFEGCLDETNDLARCKS